MVTAIDWQNLANGAAVFGAITGGLSLSAQAAREIIAWRRQKRGLLTITMHARNEATYLDLRILVRPEDNNEGLYAVVRDAKRSGLLFAHENEFHDWNEKGRWQIRPELWDKAKRPEIEIMLDAEPGNTNFSGRCIAVMPDGNIHGWIHVSIYSVRHKRINSRTLPISVIS